MILRTFGPFLIHCGCRPERCTEPAEGALEGRAAAKRTFHASTVLSMAVLRPFQKALV